MVNGYVLLCAMNFVEGECVSIVYTGTVSRTEWDNITYFLADIMRKFT